jgi:ferredoxin
MAQEKQSKVIPRGELQRLFESLRGLGYKLVGPTVRESAIVYDEINSIDDLPEGWTDEQDGGTYRLKRRDDAALFGYAVGPHSWKKYLLPPVSTLWRAKKDGNSFTVIDAPDNAPRYAFIGVRSCELHAIAIQDKVFLHGQYTDKIYASRREDVFMVAVNCGQAGGTCFCVSMETGPRATAGYDIALTEIIDGGRHEFLAEPGTERGESVISALTGQIATDADERAADAIVQRTAASMGRVMDTTGIRDLLARNYEHDRWTDVADRCLTCGNCTLVCPTCFCTTVEDVSDLRGEEAERVRKWDSCFTMDFTYTGAGSVRSSARSRYRQWMTHKLGTWIDQFGTSGCVGCGRCVTWCPVAIDITEEVHAIRESESPKAGAG